ncbi:MAG: FHA domain-containing protein [Actinomycetaceae bacterium]|nr:FHA domain-containing protein [Actinomycetaceae bacterium]MDY6083182.1 FHA domain-containing protein [Actinomycetaceae bacterium]
MADISDEFDVAATSQFSAIDPSEIDQPEVPGKLSTEDRIAIDALPSGSALLIALSGPNRGARFLLDSERTTAGRHPHSDIFLDDSTVSRKHAVFVREGTRYSVKDSGSLNGTYVNRERADEAVLQTSDEIQIGKFRLTFYASKADR